jgi:nitrous oxidase accessory protein NosD
MSVDTYLDHSAWQNKSVPTVLIGKVKGSKLQDAIDRAPPYTRVIISAGTYSEQLSITKPLELVGEPGTEVLLNGRAPCLTIYGDIDCYVSNLSMQPKAGPKGTRDSGALLVSGGRPIVYRVEASSVSVCGSASPTVRECTIIGNASGNGLSIMDQAGGTYTKCRVAGHSGHCLFVSSTGDPVLEENEFEAMHHDGKVPVGRGIVHITGSGSSPRLRANRVADRIANAPESSPLRAPPQASYSYTELKGKRTAVLVDGFASPVFDNNTILGGVVGMMIRCSGGNYMNNAITESVACGVLVCERATAVLVRNHVQSHGCYGVAIHAAEPQLTANNIAFCKGAGLILGNECQNVVVKQSLIEKNGIGVRCVEGEGSLEDNEIRTSERGGVHCSAPGCRTRFKGNSIHSNGEYGMLVDRGAAPTVTGNQLIGHKYGMVVKTTAAPNVIDNAITANETCALWCRERCKGTFSRNQFVSGREAVVLIADGANPVLDHNEIMHPSGPVGILITEGGNGVLTKNAVRTCTVGVQIRLYADPVLENNTFDGCHETAIHVEEEGCGTIVGNVIENSGKGIVCCRGGEATIRANSIRKCSATGVHSMEGSRALVEHNDVSACENGIIIEGGDSDVIVRRNLCHNNHNYGIVSRRTGFAVIEGNRTRANLQGGYGTDNGGTADFVSNVSIGDTGPGLFAVNAGVGVFRGCSSRDGDSHGGRIASGATPSLRDCTFSGGHVSGLFIDKGAAGTVESCVTKLNRYGILFSGASTTTVKGLISEANREAGGRLENQAEVNLSGGTFRNQPVGLQIETVQRCSVTDCLLHDNVVGLESTLGGSLATVSKCTFRNNRESHVVFHTNGEAVVRECDLGEGAIGVKSHSRGQGSVLSCELRGFTVAGALFETEGSTRIEGGTIAECAVGVLSRQSSEGDVFQCLLEHNNCNVRTESRGNVGLRECRIRAAQTHASACLEGAGRLLKCTISDNTHGGVLIGAHGKPRISECVIENNDTAGIIAADRSDGLVQRNKLTGNRGYGIVLRTGNATQFVQNEVSSNLSPGLLCERGCGGLMVENTFRENHFANARMLAMSNVRMERNTFEDAENGVIVEGSSAHFKANVIQKHRECGVLISGKSIAVFEECDIKDNAVGALYTVQKLEPAAGQHSPPHSPTRHSAPDVVKEAGTTDDPQADQSAPATHTGSAAVFKKCRFARNKREGVDCGTKCLGKLLGNTFDREVCAVRLGDECAGGVEDNFFQNSVTGLDVRGANVRTKVTGNHFNSNSRERRVFGERERLRSEYNGGYLPPQPMSCNRLPMRVRQRRGGNHLHD